MKIFILLILGTITFAQESLQVPDDHLPYPKLLVTSNQIMPLPTSMIEMKMDRSWLRDTLSVSEGLVLSSTIKYQGASKSFIDSDLFLIVVGSAVALGAAAAYFKLESDDYYDKYLLTNDKSIKNKTDRYDLYSGIALGAMEINVGILIYKFLTD